MTRSMTRWTLLGCMAMAALSVVAVLDVGTPTAEAAPSVSPYAGTYAWTSWRTAITISDEGLIASGYSIGGGRGGYGLIRGKIRAGGKYSFELFKNSGRDGSTFEDKSTGKMALDADGNIVGKEKKGESFVWLRQ